MSRPSKWKRLPPWPEPVLERVPGTQMEVWCGIHYPVRPMLWLGRSLSPIARFFWLYEYNRRLREGRK